MASVNTRIATYILIVPIITFYGEYTELSSNILQRIDEEKSPNNRRLHLLIGWSSQHLSHQTPSARQFEFRIPYRLFW